MVNGILEKLLGRGELDSLLVMVKNIRLGLKGLDSE